MQVVPNGDACECGGRGGWEQYSSGNALVRFARQRMGEQPSVLEEASGGNPDRVTGPMVTEAAEAGDWLGIGVANLVAAFDPEVVVIGGGVSQAAYHPSCPPCSDPTPDWWAQQSWPGERVISPGGSPGSARAPAARGTGRRR